MRITEVWPQSPALSIKGLFAPPAPFPFIDPSHSTDWIADGYGCSRVHLAQFGV